MAKAAIVIDGRKLTRAQVAAKAEKHFGLGTEEDWGPEPGDHGFFWVETSSTTGTSCLSEKDSTWRQLRK